MLLWSIYTYIRQANNYSFVEILANVFMKRKSIMHHFKLKKQRWYSTPYLHLAWTTSLWPPLRHHSNQSSNGQGSGQNQDDIPNWPRRMQRNICCLRVAQRCPLRDQGMLPEPGNGSKSRAASSASAHMLTGQRDARHTQWSTSSIMCASTSRKTPLASSFDLYKLQMQFLSTNQILNSALFPYSCKSQRTFDNLPAV